MLRIIQCHPVWLSQLNSIRLVISPLLHIRPFSTQKLMECSRWWKFCSKFLLQYFLFFLFFVFQCESECIPSNYLLYQYTYILSSHKRLVLFLGLITLSTHLDDNLSMLVLSNAFFETFGEINFVFGSIFNENTVRDRECRKRRKYERK